MNKKNTSSQVGSVLMQLHCISWLRLNPFRFMLNNLIGLKT